MKIVEKNYLNFNQVPFAYDKTECYSVCTKSGAILAQVKWHAPWSRYCFFPIPNTVSVLDAECLKEVTSFISELMLTLKPVRVRS